MSDQERQVDEGADVGMPAERSVGDLVRAAVDHDGRAAGAVAGERLLQACRRVLAGEARDVHAIHAHPWIDALRVLPVVGEESTGAEAEHQCQPGDDAENELPEWEAATQGRGGWRVRHRGLLTVAAGRVPHLRPWA